MGGGKWEMIIGVLLICGGLLVICIGLFMILGFEEWPYVVLYGSAMSGLGLFMLLDSTKESSNQEKKGSDPEVRSRNEWICGNCGSQNKQGLDKCIWCGTDLK